MINEYEKYFLDFERPPFAPVYRPTEDEFKDPIEYIKAIRPEAEKYGVVKIVPPESFRPPFAIDKESFEFIPRVQQLNQLDGILRSKNTYTKNLYNYWQVQGFDPQISPIEGSPVDLFELNKMVVERGGVHLVDRQRAWRSICVKLGYRSNPTAKLKSIYNQWIEPYERDMKNFLEKKQQELIHARSDHQQLQGRRRTPRTKSMAGIRRSIRGCQSRNLDAAVETKCSRCDKQKEGQTIVTCADCYISLHLHCCEPPLIALPKSSWKCRGCAIVSTVDAANDYGFVDSQTKYSLNSFSEYADLWKTKHFGRKLSEISCDDVEKEFWRIVYDQDSTISVKYGADLLASKVGSGFPMRKLCPTVEIDQETRRYYTEHPWNLNNLSVLNESVLSFFDSEISGMIVPWVYVGMCFSAFCWHTEDHWTYSVNYLHWGARKIWYGISGSDGGTFDRIVKEFVPDLFQRQPDLLHHITTTFNPLILMEKGLKIYSVHQEPGEFVITFPRAYHAGYNEGLNFAEAVNFAPPDWLQKGKLCKADYALVRRNCVFAFEELVTKIARCASELSATMRLAVFEQLAEFFDEENKFRQNLTMKGVVRTTREYFENVCDDLRSCVVCKTTTFLSAVTCPHGLACLEHSNDFCSLCSPRDLTLKYRYTVDELLLFLHGLRDGSEIYVNWRKKLTCLLQEGADKPHLSDVKDLIEMAHSHQFPHCELLERAVGLVKQCEKSSQKLLATLTRRIRTRKKSRLENSGQNGLEDLVEFRQSVDSLPLIDENLESSVSKCMERIANWRERSSVMIKNAKAVDADFISFIDPVNTLLNEADDFNFKLLEVDELKEIMKCCQWLKCAHKFINWKLEEEMNSANSNGDSDDLDLLEIDYTKGKWNLQRVYSFIKEGFLIGEHNPQIVQAIGVIQEMVKSGHKCERQAEEYLSNKKNEGIGLDAAEEKWLSLEDSGWMFEENFKQFQSELESARDIHSALTGEDQSNFSLKDFAELLKESSKSFFIRGSTTHMEIIKLHKRVSFFREEICRLFLRTKTFCSVFELLCGRKDLPTLIEGFPQSLQIFDSYSVSDHWSGIDQFTSPQKRYEYVDVLSARQLTLVRLLRKVNDELTAKETCFCGSVSRNDIDEVKCFLCHTSYHAVCAQKFEIPQHIPIGIYLCMHCNRSNWPNMKEVLQLCTESSVCAEQVFVQKKLKRAESAYQSALSAAQSNETSKLMDAVISLFCEEMVDPDRWTIIMNKVLEVNPVSVKEKELHTEIRNSYSVFPMNLAHLTGGRSSSIKDGRKRACKRKATLSGDFCSADKCLCPFGDMLNWTRCESGCKRWFHNICVGLSQKRAKPISFSCPHCSSQRITQ